jgi:hypothetical protein
MSTTGKNIKNKKEHVFAMAAMFYRLLEKKTYAETGRRVRRAVTCFGWYISDTQIEVNMKRRGIGFSSRHPGIRYEIGTEWVLVGLTQVIYSRSVGGGKLEWFISHHHSNGAAYEVRKGQACLGCGAVPPSMINTWKHLHVIGDKR